MLWWIIVTRKKLVLIKISNNFLLADCEWGEYVAGECVECATGVTCECGIGTQTLTRTIKNEETGDGKPCEGDASLEQSCVRIPCIGNYKIMLLIWQY